jgi:hypothetical protein
MLTDTQKQVLKRIVSTLKKAGIPYQISGALAAMIRGSSRPFKDIDIDIYKKDIQRVRDLFDEAKGKGVEHIQDTHFDMHLLHFDIEGVHIDFCQVEDCYFKSPDGSQVIIQANPATAQEMNVDGVTVSVQDKEELIAYKKVIARETDLQDIEEMMKSSH